MSGNPFRKLIQMWKARFGPGHRQTVSDCNEENDFFWKNPYIPYFREILEQILTEKHISYQEFRPVLIDRELVDNCLATEEYGGKWTIHGEAMAEVMDDGIQSILMSLEKDLNYLRILTDRPEYFFRYAGTMYEENGLIILLDEKNNPVFDPEEVIIDLEQTGRNLPKQWMKAKMYLPVWKKRWETLGNLDISVPIGYNTLIVKTDDFKSLSENRA